MVLRTSAPAPDTGIAMSTGKGVEGRNGEPEMPTCPAKPLGTYTPPVRLSLDQSPQWTKGTLRTASNSKQERVRMLLIATSRSARSA